MLERDKVIIQKKSNTYLLPYKDEYVRIMVT